MAKNIIFDFGCVLLDWNPHYVYDKYFGSVRKAQWFLDNIGCMSWNVEMDAGKPFSQGIEERVALFPEWEKEIRMYRSQWYRMVGKEVPGMYSLECELRRRGYGIWGLSNWSRETFSLVSGRRVFTVLDGYIISGDVGCIKPGPEIFRLLLDKFHLEASDCLFVDDNQANVDGAIAAGIPALLFQDCSSLRSALALA